ncbi:MAG TPA: ECF-type sigma factor [Bryobacteraceae bacterium]|jgi:RNA polymerase sigma factor (TIGR02999 family)|nr:ECF-type sigma factor [Bryobacteraceae bacterium]
MIECDSEAGGQVTRLLNEWQQGNQECFGELSRLIYAELHRIAASYLRNSPHATLQPTALINEAYLRLAAQNDTYSGRKHFFALAARVMRQILADMARSRKAAKRGSGEKAVSIDAGYPSEFNDPDRFLMLDEAMTNLHRASPRLAEIVELHYFGGLTGAEIAGLLNTSAATVSRQQRLAEALLRQALCATP